MPAACLGSESWGRFHKITVLACQNHTCIDIDRVKDASIDIDINGCVDVAV